MLRKGLVFVSPTLFGLALGMAAQAAPAANLIPIASSGAPVTNVDYYYPGDDYGAPPYYGRGLADVPGDVIGGALGIIGGAIGGALHGPDYYSRPYYGPGYGAPYYGPSYGGPYYYGEPSGAACAPDAPYFDSGTGACLAGSGDDF